MECGAAGVEGSLHDDGLQGERELCFGVGGVVLQGAPAAAVLLRRQRAGGRLEAGPEGERRR